MKLSVNEVKSVSQQVLILKFTLEPEKFPLSGPNFEKRAPGVEFEVRVTWMHMQVMQQSFY